MEKIVEWSRPQMTIWRISIACCIPKATNTHSGCVTVTVFQSNIGCTNSISHYATRTWRVLLHSVLEVKQRVWKRQALYYNVALWRVRVTIVAVET